MKFSYKFNNLFGTVYRKGNLLFTPDGNTVISPVGNRITIFDLKSNKSQTLSVESMYNYTAMDLSPNGCMLVTVNEKGQAHIISMLSQTVIYKYKFSAEVKSIKFSPDGKYFAAIKENFLMIFKTPGAEFAEFGSFIVHKVYRTAFDDCTCLDWSDDSQLISVGAKDNCTRIYAVKYLKNYRPFVVGGHTDSVVGAFFEENSLNIHTVSRNGQLCLWRCSLKLENISGIKQEIDDNVEAEGPAEKRLREEDSSEEEEEDDIATDNPIEKAVDKETMALEDDTKDAEEIKPDPKDKKHPFVYSKNGRYYLADEPRKENPKAQLTSVAYHKKTKILIVAFDTGSFYLYELPGVSMIHSLNISEYKIETCAFNNTGDWIALGAPGLGQLLVWEWQSEQYIMKQQGHSSEMNCVAYSPDGQFIATGGGDAKIKLWNVINGFCFVTFTEHTSAVTGISFSNSRKFLVSSSLDGTVRAFDIIRYRNFKTFTSPRLVQFACVAIDYSGELVAAGGQDVFEIYLWSVKFGHLLEILSGHEGPVVSLAFSPVATSSRMVSVSWDETVKIWNCLETTTVSESIELMSGAVCVAFKPNGEEVAVATLNSNIMIFDVRSAAQVATIEGRQDLGSAVSDVDTVSAKKNQEARAFSTIVYSADGECILAGGKSKFVCIYHVHEGLLLKKFEITQNHSLDGMWDFINRRALTDFGNMALIEEREELEGGNTAIKLPGVMKGDLAARSLKPEVLVSALKFSPSGQSFAAATTEGLLVYSLEKGIIFDPYYLSLEVTPKTIRECLKAEEYSTAIVVALKLNEQKLIQEVMEQIPHHQVNLIVPSLPDDFAQMALNFIAKMLQSTPHVEFYLVWANTIMTHYGQKDGVMAPHTLVALHQALNFRYESFNKICDFNKYTLQVLKKMSKLKLKSDGFKDLLTENEENMEDDDGNFILLNKKHQRTADSSDDATSSEE